MFVNFYTICHKILFEQIHHVHVAAVKISVKITPFAFNSSDKDKKAGVLLR